MKPFRVGRRLSFSLAVMAALLVGAASALLGICGPFADVSDAGFCPFVLEIFYLGITTGLTPTTYDPASSVTRLQMAGFLSRTVDRVLRRGSLRAALDRFWTPQSAEAVALGMTSVSQPVLVKSDGAEIFVVSPDRISRFRASDGSFLDDFLLPQMSGLLVARGFVFSTYVDVNDGPLLARFKFSGGGGLHSIPSKARSMTFDGARIFLAHGPSPSVSIVTVGDVPGVWTVATVTTGFVNPWGTIFDGTNVWVTDIGAGTLLRLQTDGAILQTVTVGAAPFFPAFDGTNIWTPNQNSNSISVVRASGGAVLATLTGNSLDAPNSAAFDGERILVTNQLGGTVSLFKAADLTPIGSFSTGAGSVPYGACSDGIDFWVALNSANKLLRF